MRSLIGIVLIVAMLGPGCAGRQKAMEPEAAAPAPEDFTIRFGQGGGFSGLWQGYTIRPDGTVWQWSGAVAGRDEEPAGQLSVAQMDALWQRVEASDFFDQDTRVVGNMTAFIEVQAGGRTHRGSWIPRVLGDPETPLEQLYAYSRKLAEAAGS